MLDLPDSNGNEEKVESMEEFRKAVDDAKEKWEEEGGHIIASGVLQYDGKKFKDLKFNKPLVIRADTVGGCTIEGDGKIGFENSKNVWVYGINFRNKSSERDTVSFKNCENCVIAGCDFQTTSSFKKSEKGKDYPWFNYLCLSNGDSNCIAYNNFHDKEPSRGHFVLLAGKNRGATRTVIEYNHFKNHEWVKNNKWNKDKGEALKIGDSDLGSKAFGSIIRYNLFEKCKGDAECITNKSSCNIYHHNTFRNNVGSLVLRHGNFSIVRDNVFLGPSNGVRVYGTQFVKNNYFRSEKKIKRAILCPLAIGNGKNDEEKNDASYVRVRDTRIENNVFIAESDENEDKTMIVTWGRGDGNKKPEDNKFLNNIIVAKSGTMLKLDKADKGKNEFNGNILFNQGSAKYGDILTPNETQDQCRPPGEIPPLPDHKDLTETDVGPKSTRSDQPHCSREELQELIEFARDQPKEELVSLVAPS